MLNPRYLADLLRRQMAKRGMNQTQLAEFYGVSKVHMGRWLKGTDHPPAKHLAVLANGLNVDLELLKAARSALIAQRDGVDLFRMQYFLNEQLAAA